MMKGYLMIIFGLLFLILGIYGFISTEPFYAVVVIIFSFGIIIDGIFHVKGYFNNTYYLAGFIIITLFGLISFYNFLSIPFKNFDYFFIVAFICGIIYLSLSYLHRYKGELP